MLCFIFGHLDQLRIRHDLDQGRSVARQCGLEGLGQRSRLLDAEAFGALFTAPPTIETFAKAPDWHAWGDLTAGDDSEEYYFVMVRGRLAAEGEEARAQHDAIAAGGEEAAKQAGDVAHVVYLGATDPQEYLAFDIWTDGAQLEAFYGDPAFQQAVASLFASPPAVTVFRSTDWHQW